jgi:gas vesicle protein
VNKEKILLGVFVGGMVTSGAALSDCPSDMPKQLREDCIVYEGAGASFPTSDYAHINMYKEWITSRRSSAKADQTTRESQSKTIN